MPRPLKVFTNAITRVMSSPGAGAPRDVEAATAGIVRRGRVTLKKYLTGYFACAYRDTFETRLDGVSSTVTRRITMTTLTKSATPTGIPAAVLPRLIDEGHGPNPWYGADVQSALEDVDATLAARRPAPGRHNIAEIALHHAFWLHEVRGRLIGGTVEAFALPGEDWFVWEGGAEPLVGRREADARDRGGASSRRRGRDRGRRSAVTTRPRRALRSGPRHRRAWRLPRGPNPAGEGAGSLTCAGASARRATL